MAYYNVCPKCGANLDPGEHCECDEDKRKIESLYTTEKESNQICFDFESYKSNKDYNIAL